MATDPEDPATADGDGDRAADADAEAATGDRAADAAETATGGARTPDPASLPALETYATDAGATVELRAQATALCPHDDVRDQYEVFVEYRPDGRYVEIESVRRLLDDFVDRTISHEAFCEALFRALRDALDPAELVVEARPQEYAAVSSTFRRELSDD